MLTFDIEVPSSYFFEGLLGKNGGDKGDEGVKQKFINVFHQKFYFSLMYPTGR